jgi:hypothetical protein
MPEQNIFTYSQTNTSLFEAFGFKLDGNIISVAEVENQSKFLQFKAPEQLSQMEKGKYKFFDPDNPYHSYLNQIDMERVFIYGIPIRYYPVLAKEQQKYYNDIYGESRDRFYQGAILEKEEYITRLTEINPIILWGYYKSEPLNQELTEYMIDSNKSATFTFNILYFRKMLDRDPNPGDLLIPWDMPEFLYEITKVVPDNKFLYVPKHFNISATLVQFTK